MRGIQTPEVMRRIDGSDFQKRYQLRKVDWKNTTLFQFSSISLQTKKPIGKVLQSEYSEMYTDAELDY